ncbi:MAG TPA: hypothetical protein VN699_20910 [Pirellulales bacterium]|nr:hypothetical protein [Pirellulales bacterium]
MRLTTFNVEGFLDQFPAELLAEVRHQADRLPPDDDEKGWGGVGLIGGTNYDTRRFSAEQIWEHEMEGDRCFRIGVRIYREALARRKGAT